MYRVIAVLLIVLLLVGCTRAEAWWDDAELLVQEYFDLLEIADVTPRLSLSGVIADMQEVARNLRNLDTPSNALDAEAALLIAMEAHTGCYIGWMGSGDDAAGDECFRNAKTEWDRASELLEEMGLARLNVE